ncbi:MAG: transposase [Firmicutes bacterium]|nr:transposase [Bacillota bacterium]
MTGGGFLPARKNIIFEGAIYHIFARGNNREYIFQESKHKEYLIEKLKDSNRVFDFQLLAYVIMNNHYHLLMKTNKTPISDIMFAINNSLGKYLKRELGRTGHVFEKRYGCKLIHNDAYLLWTSRYIHRNPVRAELCSTVSGYFWSSHHLYEERFSGKESDGLVDTDYLLEKLSEDRNSAVQMFRRLMNMNEESDRKSDFEKAKQEFNLPENGKVVIICNQADRSRKSLNEIMTTMRLDSETTELIRSGSKKQKIAAHKVKFAEEAAKNMYTQKEIGDFLKVSQGTVSNMLSRRKIIELHREIP